MHSVTTGFGACSSQSAFLSGVCSCVAPLGDVCSDEHLVSVTLMGTAADVVSTSGGRVKPKRKGRTMRRTRPTNAADDDDALAEAIAEVAVATSLLSSELELGIRHGLLQCPEKHSLRVIVVNVGLDKKLMRCGFCCGWVSLGDLVVACAAWPLCGPPCCRFCAKMNARQGAHSGDWTMCHPRPHGVSASGLALEEWPARRGL